ncbi:hypothetical protein KY290_020661 [Solanum tuberosum]|uniref:ABC transporter domain-containing protein n=1 Tax=Solanum tuberosum TaxID=4113 RepID=A0ABQ7V0A4_SOLTU|nr:hypothetical protein KY290_020661 [Solanum tuberosum]
MIPFGVGRRMCPCYEFEFVLLHIFMTLLKSGLQCDLPNDLSSISNDHTLQHDIRACRGKSVLSLTSYLSNPEIPILSGFYLSVPAKKALSLVGRNGSGKSSIIPLMERFYNPTLGEVLFDGENIKNLKLDWLRSRIGLVTLEPALVSLSIRDNIAYGLGVLFIASNKSSWTPNKSMIQIKEKGTNIYTHFGPKRAEIAHLKTAPNKVAFPLLHLLLSAAEKCFLSAISTPTSVSFRCISLDCPRYQFHLGIPMIAPPPMKELK